MRECMRSVFYVSCVVSYPLARPLRPLCSPRGGLWLQVIDARVDLDRGMAWAYSRLLYRRGLDPSCCGVLGDYGACTL